MKKRFITMAYILKEDKESALENLGLLSEQDRMNLNLAGFPENPIFTPVKEDPEFMRICEILDFKYETVHERLRQWLEENERMLHSINFI